jgi:hypothetical protein
MEMMEAAPRAALAFIVAAGLALLPEPAAAKFGKASNISGVGEARQAQVAADADGNALIVWRQVDGENFRILLRSRAASGALGAITALSKRGQRSDTPQIAMGPAGDALIVWSTDIVQARARSASGTLGPIMKLSRVNSAAPQVAMNASSDAIVVWRRFDEKNSVIRIDARARSASGVLGPVQTLSDSTQNADVPQVAITDAGDAMVVWRHFDGTNWRIQARTRFADGTLGPVRMVSKTNEDGQGPKVVLDADGTALVVWQSSVGHIEAAQGSLTEKFGAVKAISDGTDTFKANSPVVALDGDGNALIAWTLALESAGGASVVEARTRAASGKLGPIMTLSEERANAPKIAGGADGSAVLIWNRFDGTVSRIEAVTFSNGKFGKLQSLTGATQNTDAPDIAIAGNGKAVATWERQDGPGDVQIQAATGP